MASGQAIEMQEPQEIVKRKSQGLAEQQRRWGLIFLSPWIIGFILFTAAPIIISFYWTFTEYSLQTPNPPKYVGIDNWVKLFTDPLALKALEVTARFAIIAVPFFLLIPLGMAALLNAKHLWGKNVWRTLFYLPYMVPAVSGIFIWQAFFNGQSGWLNRLLRIIGLNDPPSWLQDERTILFAFLMMGFWGVGNAMLTMLASMQGVPQELYEAADVDGAGAWLKFSRITIPMISPVIFYNLVLIAIGMMQYFVVPYIVTRGTGQPNNSAYFYNMHFYRTAFKFGDMGYGATQAWFIFLISLVLTIGLFATSGRWVFYAGGDD